MIVGQLGTRDQPHRRWPAEEVAGRCQTDCRKKTVSNGTG